MVTEQPVPNSASCDPAASGTFQRVYFSCQLSSDGTLGLVSSHWQIILGLNALSFFQGFLVCKKNVASQVCLSECLWLPQSFSVSLFGAVDETHQSMQARLLRRWDSRSTRPMRLTTTIFEMKIVNESI
jgi:hypothetical protein